MQTAMILLLSALTTEPALLFHRFVEDAAASKGITDVTVIVCAKPPANTFLARSQFNHHIQRVIIREDVLATASPRLLQYLAFHEVCHIYLWRSEQPDTEDDVDVCVRSLFWSRNEWGRAIVERDAWRP